MPVDSVDSSRDDVFGDDSVLVDDVFRVEESVRVVDASGRDDDVLGDSVGVDVDVDDVGVDVDVDDVGVDDGECWSGDDGEREDRGCAGGWSVSSDCSMSDWPADSESKSSTAPGLNWNLLPPHEGQPESISFEPSGNR